MRRTRVTSEPQARTWMWMTAPIPRLPAHQVRRQPTRAHCGAASLSYGDARGNYRGLGCCQHGAWAECVTGILASRRRTKKCQESAASLLTTLCKHNHACVDTSPQYSIESSSFSNKPSLSLPASAVVFRLSSSSPCSFAQILFQVFHGVPNHGRQPLG